MTSTIHTLILKSIIFDILLFKINTLLAFDGDCGSTFRGKCWCGVSDYDRIHQYVVNCTNEGFSDTSVLEYMSPEVEVLIFTGNVLVTLPWNIFGRINEYHKLRVIDMSNNHIREIRGKSEIWC